MDTEDCEMCQTIQKVIIVVCGVGLLFIIVSLALRYWL